METEIKIICPKCNNIIITNKNRNRILKLLQNRDYNILQLSKAIKIGYKSTYYHVKKLEEAKLINVNKIINLKGRNNMVSLKDNKKTSIIIGLNTGGLDKLAEQSARYYTQ